MTAGNASKITDIALVNTGCYWIDSSMGSFSLEWGGRGSILFHVNTYTNCDSSASYKSTFYMMAVTGYIVKYGLEIKIIKCSLYLDQLEYAF